MKTTLTIFAIAALLSVSSCKNGKQAPDTTDIPDTTVVDTDLEKKPLSEFRKALAALPDRDRIDIFNALSNEMKAQLWKDRIDDVMPALKEGEQEAMRQVWTQITPGMYTDTGNKAFVESFSAWEKTALTAFGNDSSKFYNITGLLDGTIENKDGAAPPVKQDDACNCSIPRDFCKFRWPFFTLVCSNPPPCNFTRWGCGPFGAWICDGLCIKNPNPGE